MNPQPRPLSEKRAKDGKRDAKKKGEKYTSQGVPLSFIANKIEEEVKAAECIETTIKQIVGESYKNNDMGATEYYFIAGNYFCETSGGVFLPAELAIVKFTFNDGIINQFHTLINPGKLPMGYQYHAKSHSEATHDLPIPPMSKGEMNYAIILKEIIAHLGNETELPPLFTTKENVKMIQSFLEQFCIIADYDKPENFRVFPLHRLFFDIKYAATNGGTEGTPFSSISAAEFSFNAQQYAFMKHSGCDFHQDEYSLKYCALYHVQRWTYTFIDYLCVDLKIVLIPGKHFPANICVSEANKLLNKNLQASVDGDNIQSGVSIASTSPVSTTDFVWKRRSPCSSPPISSSSNEEDFPSLGNRRKSSSSKKNNKPPQNPLNNSSLSNINNSLTRRNDNNFVLKKSVAENPFNGSKQLRGRSRGSEMFQKSVTRTKGGRLSK